MSKCLLRLILFGVVLALAGCAGAIQYDSTGTEPWLPADSITAPMGVTLVLPEGSWRVNEVEPGRAIEFQEKTGPARIVLMRISSMRIHDRQVALSRLFSRFPAKKQTFLEDRVLRSGREATVAEYVIQEKDKPLSVRACIVQGDEWVHELITWGLNSATADAVADSMVFVDTP